ncbi:hypothetical protein [Parabacteroides sp. HGS0025]|uniref:hypothetical protein n=1 Tax=Parabacteroides sp. HGS0025 TaxID=1078087 RepID=UPI0006172110|nr:hypothetical protein [Parabacteroides sp. HGS0025]
MPNVADEHQQGIIYSQVEFGQNILALCDVMPEEANDFGKGGYSLDLEFSDRITPSCLMLYIFHARIVGNVQPF